MRILSVAALALSLALVPAVLPSQNLAQAQGRGQGKFLQQLNLSSDQQQQLETLRQQHQGQVSPLYQQVRQLRDEIESLIGSGASREEIMAKFAQLQPLQQQIGEMHLEHRLAVRAILTPDQQTQLNQLARQYREQRSEKRGGRFSK